MSALVIKNFSATAIGSEATIWTPATGKKFRLLGGLLSVGTAAGNVTLKDNTGGTTILILPKAPLDTPFSIAQLIDGQSGAQGIISGAVNQVLTATGAATATLSGYIFGTEES